MAKQRKTKYKDMSPVERSVFSRERGIARMKQNIEQIRQEAERKITGII